MSSNPLLSICIPTYNRDRFLKECLDSIVSQFADSNVSQQVEVVLSDNGSTDNTRSTVLEYQKSFSNIRYIRSETNLGVDRNILNVVHEASGRFCWLLGDDDALFFNALTDLLPKLAEDKHDYFLANTWGYDQKLAVPALSRPNLHIHQDSSFASLRDFVKSIPNYRNVVGYFGGLSGQIFRRQVWLNAPNKEQYIGTQTLHLPVILSAFKELPVLVVAEPMVKTRADNMRWETFPGLESSRKRQAATRNGIIWIFNLYGIPYSKARLAFYYYAGLVYGFLLMVAKKTFLRSAFIKKTLKRLLRK